MRTWTCAAKEFTVMEDTQGHIAQCLVEHKWLGPPIVRLESPNAECRGRGTDETTSQTWLCPSKKLPSGVTKDPAHS